MFTDAENKLKNELAELQSEAYRKVLNMIYDFNENGSPNEINRGLLVGAINRYVDAACLAENHFTKMVWRCRHKFCTCHHSSD